MIAAAAAFLAAYAVPILQPNLPPWAAQTCAWVTRTVWVLFVMDLLVRLSLAEGRWPCLRRPVSRDLSTQSADFSDEIGKLRPSAFRLLEAVVAADAVAGVPTRAPAIAE